MRLSKTMGSTIKENYASFMTGESFLRKLVVHMINHRIQEFIDPLTSTLVLLATSPLQLVFCESGLILFKTSLLPVLPYTMLSVDEKQMFYRWIAQASNEHESCDSSGQFTLTVALSPAQPPLFVCRRSLLSSFVHVMRHHNGTFNDPVICCTLCNIILQRFMAIVPVSSDAVSLIMAQLNIIQPLPPPPPLCPLLLQPSGLHYEPATTGGPTDEELAFAAEMVDTHRKKRKRHSHSASYKNSKNTTSST